MAAVFNMNNVYGEIHSVPYIVAIMPTRSTSRASAENQSVYQSLIGVLPCQSRRVQFHLTRSNLKTLTKLITVFDDLYQTSCIFMFAIS